jgi:protein tyrosine phosphatase
MVHFQGYHKTNAYIVTQIPLSDTTETFWRMVCENESTIIVYIVTESQKMVRTVPE